MNGANQTRLCVLFSDCTILINLLYGINTFQILNDSELFCYGDLFLLTKTFEGKKFSVGNTRSRLSLGQQILKGR